MAHAHSHTQQFAKTAVAPCPAPVPEQPVSCCELTCFERPQYFCGHMLTDADLTKEQRYVIEKNKLYHRNLHGHGVVCGLRLTCDHHCPGHVMISDGYAIDNCGNDLVVCEPQSLNVIGRLREKGYLVETQPPDPCQPKEPEPDCKVRQCFYVIACYQEEQTEFTTPFVAGCRPTVRECEATRIREGVRFDVVAELPKESSPLESLKWRLEACFKVFSEGAFADALEKNRTVLETIVTAGTKREDHTKYYDLFCQLRGLFLLYLKKHPDNYNCIINDDIWNIPFPDAKQEEEGNYKEKVRDTFCHLLELVWQYVISCALGELVPLCSEPQHASCVVLGTVEIENGRVVHVCNCPRSYVWSFANFFEVLLATLMNEVACESDNEDDKQQAKKHVCCREFDLDCKWLLDLLSTNPAATGLASTASFDAVSMLKRSVRSAFDFTRAGTFSTQMFRNLTVQQAKAGGSRLGLTMPESVAGEPASAKVWHPLDIIRMAGLATAADPIMLTQRNDRTIATAFADRRSIAVLEPQVEGRIKQAEDSATEANAQIQKLQGELAGKQEEIRQVTVRLESAEKLLGDLQSRFNELNQRIESRQRRRRKEPTPGRSGGEE